MPHPPKLPVWKTTRECYRLVFAHARDFVRISWLWILVMIPIYAASHSLIWLLQQSHYKLPDGPLLSVVTELILFIPDSIFLAAIAVRWHQLLLTNRRAETIAPWKLDRTTVQYGLLGYVIFILPGTLGMMLLPAELPSRLVLIAASIAAVLSITVSLRFCLKFPAISLGRSLSLTDSWKLTAGSTLSLLLVSLICCLPSLVTLLAVGLPFVLLLTPKELFESFATSVPVSVAGSLAYAIPTIFGVTLFSLAYRHFVLTPHPLDSQGNLP